MWKVATAPGGLPRTWISTSMQNLGIDGGIRRSDPFDVSSASLKDA